MSGVKEIGKYNIDFAGKAYEGNNFYEMVIIDIFDDDGKPTGSRKVLYFRYGDDLVIPEFKTEAEVERYLCYPDNSKLSVKVATIITLL